MDLFNYRGTVVYGYIYKVGYSDNEEGDERCYVNEIPMGEERL